MPSALPTSLSYYYTGNKYGEDEWQKSESHNSTVLSEKTHVERMSQEMESGSKLEIAADGEVHAIGENMV